MIKQRRPMLAAWLAVVVLPGVLGGDPIPSDSREPVSPNYVTFRLIEESELPSRDAGTIESIAVTEGSKVFKGDVLVVLESTEQTLAVQARKLAMQIATLRAEDTLPLQSATAQLKEAEAGRSVAEISLQISESESQSKVSVDIAEAETRLRQLELDRAENARDSFRSSISESHIDRLKTSVRKGELEIQQAKDEIVVKELKPKAGRAEVDRKIQEINRHQALVEQERSNLVVAGLMQQVRQNELDIAKSQLERRFIRAPYDGLVTRLDVGVGEWVEPGATAVRLIGLKRLRAEGFLKATRGVAQMQGSPVEIRVKGVEESFIVQGRITFVSREVDPQNMQVKFHAEVDNEDSRILPGMSGTCLLEGE